MRPIDRRTTPRATLLALLLPALWVLPICARAHAAPTLNSVVDMFGQAAIADGGVAGIEIAVVVGSSAPHFFGYGVPSLGAAKPPNDATIFQIASITKIFTTNLLAQLDASGAHPLNEPLANFTAQLGTLPAATAQVTLLNLADFTAGFPDLPPQCMPGQTPPMAGCLPGTPRPNIHQYNAQDFAAIFRTSQISPPPQPYLYSDIDLGMLGLLLAAPPGTTLSNTAVQAWQQSISTHLTWPLAMRSTWLNVPKQEAPRAASGYTPAQASALLSGGHITALPLTSPGAGYTQAPAVTIIGGGGTGAQAAATLNTQAGTVAALSITNAGTDYIAPPVVTFSAGTGKAAAGTAIIANGKLVGVAIQSGGSYTAPPAVTISGGRVGGADATATAVLDHGAVSYVSITNAGSGYVDPLRVIIAAGPAVVLPVPIWAPAGALKSTAHDLAILAAAALGHTNIGGRAVPAAITQAFAEAETPYACVKGPPALSTCTGNEAGLAWIITPSAPLLISKSGGIPGFSSAILLLPGADSAIIVLANGNVTNGVAPPLAANILYALYHEGLLQNPPHTHKY